MRRCTVTSSALVGSSAMISAGLQRDGDGDQHALPHAARQLVRILAGAQLRPATGRRAPAARARAARMRPRSPRAVDLQDLGDLRADGLTGFSELAGSCGIRLIAAPRMRVEPLAATSAAMSVPLSRMAPPLDRGRSPAAGRSPPAPSWSCPSRIRPPAPRTSPGAMRKRHVVHARGRVVGRHRRGRRPRSSVARTTGRAAHARAPVPIGVADAVGRQHHQHDDDAGRGGQPPGAARCSCGPRRSAGPIPASAAARRSRGSRGSRSRGWREPNCSAASASTEVSEFGRTWRHSTAQKRAAAAEGGLDIVAAPHPHDLRARQPGEARDRGDADGDGGVDRAEAEQDDDR